MSLVEAMEKFYNRYSSYVSRTNEYDICESIGFLKALSFIYPEAKDELDGIVRERVHMLLDLAIDSMDDLK